MSWTKVGLLVISLFFSGVAQAQEQNREGTRPPLSLGGSPAVGYEQINRDTIIVFYENGMRFTGSGLNESTLAQIKKILGIEKLSDK